LRKNSSKLIIGWLDCRPQIKAFHPSVYKPSSRPAPVRLIRLLGRRETGLLRCAWLVHAPPAGLLLVFSMPGWMGQAVDEKFPPAM